MRSQLLAATPPQWRDLFATALYLGLRKGEVFALVRPENCELRVITPVQGVIKGNSQTG